MDRCPGPPSSSRCRRRRWRSNQPLRGGAVVRDRRTRAGRRRRPQRAGVIYTISPVTEESEDVGYTVPLEYTPCNYGGYRHWFRCPGEGCGRRCRKLHLSHRRWAEYFLCQEGYDLGYTTSWTSVKEWKKDRAQVPPSHREGRRREPPSSPH